MIRTRSSFSIARLVGVLALVSACPAVAQENIPWGATLGSYSDAENWNHPEGDFLPDSTFEEIALVGNGGTAFVDDTPDASPAGLIINAGSTLEIRDGGNLTVVIGSQEVALGSAAVDNGRLVGLSGGSFTAESLSSGAAGRIELSGTASVTINGASQLAGTTRLAGPNVDFSTESLATTGTVVAAITGPTHSAIDVGGEAMLGGNLMLEFDGVTPSFGDTWDIVDAQSISGRFANVTSSTAAGPGLVFASQVVPGGNGQIAQAVLESRLTLEINRRTGQMQIRDVAGIEATTIDGYSISSPGGTLAPGEWNAFGLADWIPSDAHATHVGEISLTDQRVIDPGEEIGLGDLYANPARTAGFSLATEDVTFEYSVEGGQILSGLVDYTDAHNNVVLVIDPDTGNAWIQNQSVFDIHLDGYDIASDAGALDPSQWVSFASSDDEWTQANPADYHIGELNFSDSMLLAGEGEAISLGQIFTPGSARDLVFTFNTAPSGGEPMTLAGIVEYDDGPIDFGPGGGGVNGDFNGNGLVEQEDLDLVLANWGDPAAAAPATWVNDPPEGNIDQTELDKVLVNWGNTSARGLNVGAVPEPSGGIVALICLSLLAVRFRWRFR